MNVYLHIREPYQLRPDTAIRNQGVIGAGAFPVSVDTHFLLHQALRRFGTLIYAFGARPLGGIKVLHWSIGGVVWAPWKEAVAWLPE